MTSTTRTAATAMVAAVLLAGCSSGPEPRPTPSSSPTAEATSSPEPDPVVDPARLQADVAHLADVIGPRHATSPAFEAAADWVEQRFVELGYEVSRQPVDAPAGNTWGVDVPAGTSTNVVASPPGFDPAQPHVVVGAHLDTIPVAPGAEDNASGVAALLEIARLHAGDGLAVQLVAFGAEEPRGPGDDLHHFGSQAFVAAMSESQRAAMLGMVALDRVGVPGDVPVCHGGRGPATVRDALATAAAATQVPHTVCGDNRTSDHWSFERAGLPAARLGSLPYAGYHTPDDVPAVVDPAQLVRAVVITQAWLADQPIAPAADQAD